MDLGKVVRFVKEKPLLSISVLIILSTALFFRTYNYEDRLYVIADNSRDVQIATFAKDNLLIPPIGQFSSAGPFFYGPWYYWFLEAIAFLPFGLLTHWYAITSIYLLFIYLIYWIGKKLEGPQLGLVAAFLTAISPSQINFSTSVWNPSIIPTLVAISIILFIKYFETKKPIFLLLLGFFTTLGITIHFQTMLTIPIVFVALLCRKKTLKNHALNLVLVFLGAIIALLPSIYFDARHDWYNFKSLFIYLAIDQYSIWVPNRWITYITTYWPEAWAYIVGGNKYIAQAIIVSLALLSLTKLRSISKNRLFFLLAITFCLEIFLYRYYRGERFVYYSLFAHPFVLLFTAWLIYQLTKFKKAVGVFALVTITIFTLQISKKDLADRGVTLTELTAIKNQIYKTFPNKNFDIYGCQFNAETASHPLALLMYKDGRNELDGIKIGICENNNTLFWQPIATREIEIEKEKPFWYNRTTERVYTDAMHWWLKNTPQKNDFLKFLKEKLSPKCYPHC